MNLLQKTSLVLLTMATITLNSQALANPPHGNHTSFNIHVTKNSDIQPIIRACSPSARGIRCKNISVSNVLLIAKVNVADTTNKPIEITKKCNHSARGKRCSQHKKYPNQIQTSKYQPYELLASNNRCLTTARGSRC